MLMQAFPGGVLGGGGEQMKGPHGPHGPGLQAGIQGKQSPILICFVLLENLILNII